MLPTRIIFGTPQKNCLGHGICEVSPWEKKPSKSRLTCIPVKTFWLRSSEGLLSLMVPCAEIPNTVLEEHLSGQFFMMESSFVLPKFLQDRFKLSEPYLIQAGQYRIIRGKHFFLISFNNA
jgi:hypothetical protein